MKAPTITKMSALPTRLERPPQSKNFIVIMDKPNKRRTEITIETHSLTIIKMRAGKTDLVYCRNCRGEAVGFSQPHASLVFKVEAGELSRLCRDGQIHRVSPDALCARSLADYFKQEIRFVED